MQTADKKSPTHTYDRIVTDGVFQEAVTARRKTYAILRGLVCPTCGKPAFNRFFSVAHPIFCRSHRGQCRSVFEKTHANEYRDLLELEAEFYDQLLRTAVRPSLAAPSDSNLPLLAAKLVTLCRESAGQSLTYSEPLFEVDLAKLRSGQDDWFAWRGEDSAEDFSDGPTFDIAPGNIRKYGYTPISAAGTSGEETTAGPEHAKTQPRDGKAKSTPASPP